MKEPKKQKGEADKLPEGLYIEKGELYENGEPCEDLKKICLALQSGACPPGFTLDLGYNKIGDEGATALAAVLADCKPGFTLNLGGNNIGAAGAKDLAAVLADCKPGLTLNLRFNKIGDAGTTAIASVLESNVSVVIEGLEGLNALLDAYLTRNKFIREYPEHEGIIKKLCHERGFYKPSVKSPQAAPTLKELAGMTVLGANQQTRDTLPDVPEIKDFLKELETISKTLSAQKVPEQHKPNM